MLGANSNTGDDTVMSASQKNSNDNSLDTTPPRRELFFKWLFAAVVISMVAWVAFFTTISAHTDISREEIYPALDSHYFPEKAGARTFTYLGNFYLVLGAVSLTALSVGLTLPQPSHKLVGTSYQIPLMGGYWTLLDLGALTLFLAVLAATFTTRAVNKFNEYYDWPPDKFWYEISKTLGKTIALTLMVLLLPVSKTCFWWDLCNFQFERVVKYHRLLGWFLTGVVVVHATTAITSLALAGEFQNCLWPSDTCQKPGVTFYSHALSRMLTYGWIGALAMLPVVVTSLPWFRRHHFEWFYYTHFMFVPALILVHLHGNGLIYYTAPGLAAYTLDKVLSCRRGPKVPVVSLSTPVPGFVRLVVAVKPDNNLEPGQWVQLNVPAVSILQWHPMSVAACTSSGLQFDIKVLGDWTRKLQELALAQPHNLYVYADRLHGSSHSQMEGYLTHPAVVMIAGTCGMGTFNRSIPLSIFSNTFVFCFFAKAALG